MPEALNPTAASILGFLAGGTPMTGWELAAFAERSIGRFWNVTRSQLYRELRDLAARGLVEAGDIGPRERVPYQLTEAGRGAFQTWLAGDPGPDLIRHRLLLTVFFGDHLPAARLAEILADQRAAHEAQLAAYRSLEEHVREGSMASALRFGVAYETMVLDWLDGVQAEVSASDRPRPPGSTRARSTPDRPTAGGGRRGR